MMVTNVMQFLTLALFGISRCVSQHANYSFELAEDLLRNHHIIKRVRPTWNQTLPTIVSASFWILSIDEFIEVEGRFSVNMLMVLNWRNEFMTWEPNDYGGIQSQLFFTHEVWYPELELAYQAGKFENFVKDWMTVRTYNDGGSILDTMSNFKSTCSINIKYYPFDTQVCVFYLSPLSYTGEEVAMMPGLPSIYTDYFSEHGGWDLLSSSVISYKGSALCLTFTLKRKPHFFVVNIILPIMLMSVLSSLIFALPPQSGERVSYGITVLLAIAVFLTLVGDNLPKTSNPLSILSVYLMINLAVSTMICITAILNLRLYFYDGDDQIPIWARCLLRATCTGQRIPMSVKETSEGGKQTEHGRTTEHPQRHASWVDVSKAVDKLCIAGFLLVTVVINVMFVLMIALSSDE